MAIYEDPYEEAVEAQAWPGSAITHAYAYGGEELHQPMMALQSPMLQQRVPSPPTVYKELPLDSAGHVGDRGSAFVHTNGSCIEYSPAGRDYYRQRYRAALTPLSWMQKPDLFDGSSMEWGDYLELFESVAEWNGWTLAGKGRSTADEPNRANIKGLENTVPRRKG